MERAISSKMLYMDKLLNLRLDEDLIEWEEDWEELIAHLGASVNLLLIESEKILW